MLRQLTNLIKLLNSDIKEEEIAAGMILGFFAGLLSVNLFNFILVFILLLLIKANYSMFFLSFVIFKLLSIIIDPLGDIIGLVVLKANFLFPLFVFLSSIPLLAFTQFNYSVVMGNFIIALLLTPFIWIISIKLIKIYKEKLKDKVQKFKIVQAFNFLKFIDKNKGV